MARRPKADPAIEEAMNPDTEVQDDITRFIDGLDAAGLTRVIKLAEAKRNDKLSEVRQALIERTRAEAEQLGLSMDDLFPSRQATRTTPTGRQRKTAEPKYRNPETGETWAGRGRSPAWLEGKNREDYLINKAQPELPEAAE